MTALIHLERTAIFAGFLGGDSGKESTCNAGNIREVGSIPGSERSPGGGNGNPPSILAWRIPTDRGAWWAAVNGVGMNAGTPDCPMQIETEVVWRREAGLVVQTGLVGETHTEGGVWDRSHDLTLPGTVQSLPVRGAL